MAPPRPGHAPEVWTVDGIEPTPHGPVARLERPDGQTVDRPLTDLPPACGRATCWPWTTARTA
ncbi:hypothetical protein [Deinococcus aquaticus]|uniref:hypothetical protein n=1 Tax=Deinococcus aquaticus TaxID=328692 RepID=UPI0036D3E7B0